MPLYSSPSTNHPILINPLLIDQRAVKGDEGLTPQHYVFLCCYHSITRQSGFMNHWSNALAAQWSRAWLLQSQPAGALYGGHNCLQTLNPS